MYYMYLRAVDAVGVLLVLDAGVQASDVLGHNPLDVVDDGVGVGVRGQVLTVGSPTQVEKSKEYNLWPQNLRQHKSALYIFCFVL